jgi:hypothetical protein
MNKILVTSDVYSEAKEPKNNSALYLDIIDSHICGNFFLVPKKTKYGILDIKKREEA